VSSKQRIRRLQILQHAEGYLELGMARQALEALDRLEGSAALDGNAFYLRGEALRTLEHHAEAVDALLQAADFLPENIHIWLALGWCHKRQGRLDLAIDDLETALTIDPSEAIIHYNLACYWSLAHNKSQALEYLSHAFELDNRFRDLVPQEPDFDPLRKDPDFQALTAVIV